MKKFLTLFLASALTGAFCVACGETDGVYHDPKANCWVFVSTIPGEETVLLAKIGPSWDEAMAIRADFEKEYGKGNVIAQASYAGDPYSKDEWDDIVFDPESVPICYEITMTIEFVESAVPSIKSLIEYGFRGVRINGRTAICKLYVWPCTDEGAEKYIRFWEDSYNSYASNQYGVRWAGGTIVSSTYKSLGHEVHNMLIEF